MIVYMWFDLCISMTNVYIGTSGNSGDISLIYIISGCCCILSKASTASSREILTWIRIIRLSQRRKKIWLWLDLVTLPRVELFSNSLTFSAHLLFTGTTHLKFCYYRHHSISFRDDLTTWNMIHHCMNNAHMLFLVKGIIIGNDNLG